MFLQKGNGISSRVYVLHLFIVDYVRNTRHTRAGDFDILVADINVKLSDQCGIYLSCTDINVYKQMAFVRNAVCNETETIHNLILSVTVLKFVILITAKLLCSEVFHLKQLLSRKKNLLYRMLSVILLFLICLYVWQSLKSLSCCYELQVYCAFITVLESSISIGFYAQKPSVNNPVILTHARKAAVIFFPMYL